MNSNLEIRSVLSKRNLRKMLGKVRFGGLTLVKNYSMIGTELTIYSILNYTYEIGLPVLVEDIFDAFVGYVKHLQLMGLNFPMEHVGIIKVGGTDETGHVVERIQFEADPTLYLRKRERAIERAMGDDRYAYIVTGFERLLGFQRDIKGIYIMVNHIRENLGNDRRMSFNIIEGNIVEGFSFNPLPMLESVATSVVELHDHGDMIRLRLKKSLFTLISGRDEVFVTPSEVVTWW